MKNLHLPIFTILMAFLVTAVSFLPQDAHAMSITVHTDKPLYSYGDTYTISGKVNPVIPHQVVSIVVLSPNYPHPSSLSATPNSDGNYSYTLPLTIKDVSSGNFTVIAQYGVAKNQTTFSYNGPPCVPQNDYWYDGVHSAPASNPRIVDSFGNAITGPVKSGQQIQITSDLANGKNCAQTFAYIVQIEDLNGVTFSLSWITGTLLTGQSLNPAQSWTPTTAGVYTVQIFTWQSLDNPNALAPPLTTTISVEDDANLTQSSHTVSEISPKLVTGPTTIILDSPLKQFKGGAISIYDVKCMQGFDRLVKTSDGSPACVKPSTGKILIERGWATRTIQVQNTGGYEINYAIAGGELTGISVNPSGSLLISLHATSDGNLTVNIPKGLINLKHDYWTNENVIISAGPNCGKEIQSLGYVIINCALKSGMTNVMISSAMSGSVLEERK